MEQKVIHQRQQSGLETVFVAIGPKDGDRVERLAEEAIELAGPSNARVVLGHVFTRDGYAERKEALGFGRDSEATPDVVARRFAPIRAMADALEAAGIDYEVRGGIGEHADGISGMAAEAGADLVVVGGRKRSPTGKMVFGSVAQEVMLSAHCPVTFVRSDSQ